MFQELEKAIASSNYDLATKIIDNLNKEKLDPLWLKYYQTVIIEKQDQLEEAENNYRQIIKESIFPDPKLTQCIRNSIERIVKIKQERKDAKKEKKDAKKETFTQVENSQDLAVLVLENVPLEEKHKLAPSFAEIMGTDRYTATLQIPTRSWRLYKTGGLGELNYYQFELSQAGVPCFCHPVKKINDINVYQVEYIENEGESLILHCEDDHEKHHVIKLKTGDINSAVKGMIPLFELVVNFDAKKKIQKKKSTLDYIAFFDLHSISHQAIFRFNDRFYQFNQDKNLKESGTTTKQKWQNLEKHFTTKIDPQQLKSNFTLFGEGVTQFPEMLKQINSHVYLFRREETLWDEAFQLYSGLAFLQTMSQSQIKTSV